MKSLCYQMTLGTEDICYQFQYNNTPKWFEWHLVKTAGSCNNSIELSSEEIESKKLFFPLKTDESFIEYRLLAGPTGRLLSEKGLFIVHSVAFIWKGFAWLLMAKSGTGKTTQYLNWKEMWPDEVQILCGDMPILCSNNDHVITVYPSPWNGKERMGFENHKSMRLGGIIYLSQNEQNRIRPLRDTQYIIPIWNKFIGRPDTKQQILARSRFIDNLLRKYPIWRLENCGDNDSTIIMRNELEQYLQRIQHEEIYMPIWSNPYKDM